MSNKIMKYNLADEVRRLSDMGFGTREIANQVNRRNDKVNVSHMAVSRFLHSDKVQEIQTELAEGKQPEDRLRAEFRDKMYDLDDETHKALQESKKLYDTALDVLEQAQNTDDTDIKIRALKSVNETLRQRINTLEQMRKDWHTLVENGYRTFGNIDEAREVNYIQVNNMLVAFSKELCSKCRAKIVDLITQDEEE